MRHLYRRNISGLLALLVISQGCSTFRPAVNSADNTSNYCAVPHQLFNIDTLQTNKSFASSPVLDTISPPDISARSRQLVHAYGMDTDLRHLARMNNDTGAASSDYFTFLKKRKVIVLRIVEASRDALRVAEELECEKQRADQSAVALQRLEDKQRNNFTVGSLVAGAASGAIGATINNSDLNLILTISTAAVSAALGLASIFVNPKMNYPISQNMLSDVWYQHSYSALYPSGLWNVLNEVRAGNSHLTTLSLLQTIRKRWAQYDQLTNGKPGQQAQQQQLFFGSGGSYQIDDLRTLAGMLAQVEVMVRIVNQDLQKLQVEVNNIEPQ